MKDVYLMNRQETRKPGAKSECEDGRIFIMERLGENEISKNTLQLDDLATL